MAIPKPEKEYDNIMEEKLGARKQPSAETMMKVNPNIRSDLCLYRTLRTPVTRANITPIMKEVVEI